MAFVRGAMCGVVTFVCGCAGRSHVREAAAAVSRYKTVASRVEVAQRAAEPAAWLFRQ